MDFMSVQLLSSVINWVTPVVSIVASTIVTGVVSYIVKKALDKYFKRKEDEEAEIRKRLIELDQLRESEDREQRKADMVSIVKAELAPVNEKIDLLMDKVTKTEDGTLSSLRNDILTCYYRCLEKGYRGDWDFENIHHLYDAYSELHGNSFVHDVMNRFDELPTKEEYNEQRKKDRNSQKNK